MPLLFGPRKNGQSSDTTGDIAMHKDAIVASVKRKEFKNLQLRFRIPLVLQWSVHVETIVFRFTIWPYYNPVIAQISKHGNPGVLTM